MRILTMSGKRGLFWSLRSWGSVRNGWGPTQDRRLQREGSVVEIDFSQTLNHPSWWSGRGTLMQNILFETGLVRLHKDDINIFVDEMIRKSQKRRAMLMNNFQNMWDLDGRSVPRKQMGTCCSSSTCQVDQHHQMGHRRTPASHLCSCLQWKLNFVYIVKVKWHGRYMVTVS